MYSIYIEDAEIDEHWQQSGMFWEVHQRYLELHYNFDYNANGTSTRHGHHGLTKANNSFVMRFPSASKVFYHVNC